MKYLQQVKSALITALLVLVLAQVALAMVMPLMPLIICGLVLVSIGIYVYQRAKRL